MPTRILKRSSTRKTDRFGWSARFRISKVDADGVAFGWASNAVSKDGDYLVDHDEDVIPRDELEQAVYAYVEKSRKATDRHKRLADAGLIESVFLDVEKRKAMGFDASDQSVSWWVGYRIRDAEVLAKVRSGEYKEFSIGGFADREPHPEIEDAFVLKNLEIDEVGFVELGAGLDVEIKLAKEKAMSMKALFLKMLAFVPAEERAPIEKKLAKLTKTASMEDIKSKLSAEEWELIQEHLAPGDPAAEGSPEEEASEDPAEAAAEGDAPPMPPKKVAPMKAKKRDPEIERLEKEAKADREKLEKAMETIAALKKSERFSKYLGEAGKLTHAPAKPNALAKMLRAADDLIESEDDESKEVGKEMRAYIERTNAAMKESSLFKTFGATDPESGAGAKERLEAIAKTYREKDPKLSKDRAFLKAAEDNPELYSELKAERTSR